MWVLLGIFVFIAAPAVSQEPYLIPQTVFVGDRARLVIPLGDGAIFEKNWVQSADLPASPDIHLHRITGEKEHISIDFTAFTPGTIVLPAIEVPVLGIITGLPVTITSILDNDSAALSAPAIPLVVPGTSVLIYTVTASALILGIVGIKTNAWQRYALNIIHKKARRRYLIGKMKRTLKKMYVSMFDTINHREILDRLSREFRVFLSLFTEIDCQPLTAAEIARIPALASMGQELGDLLQWCDMLRFSGISPVDTTVNTVFAKLERTTDALDRG
jgi:hypothetical protein